MGACLGHYVLEELSLRAGDEGSNCALDAKNAVQFPLR